MLKMDAAYLLDACCEIDLFKSFIDCELREFCRKFRESTP